MIQDLCELERPSGGGLVALVMSHSGLRCSRKVLEQKESEVGMRDDMRVMLQPTGVDGNVLFL